MTLLSGDPAQRRVHIERTATRLLRNSKESLIQYMLWEGGCRRLVAKLQVYLIHVCIYLYKVPGSKYGHLT